MSKNDIGKDANRGKGFSVLRPLFLSSVHEKNENEIINFGTVHDNMQELDVLIFSEKDHNSALYVLLYGGAWQWTSPFALKRYCSATNGDELAIRICYDVTAIIEYFLQDERVSSIPTNDLNIHNINKFFCSTLPVLVELFLLRKSLRYTIIFS